MKGFNFFKVLVTAFIMFVGVAANAQFLSTNEAIPVLKSSLEGLRNSPATNAMVTPVTQQSTQVTAFSNAELVKRMKIRIGSSMLEVIDSLGTEGAFNYAISKYQSTMTDRKLALSEAESYYKNLLKK